LPVSNPFIVLSKNQTPMREFTEKVTALIAQGNIESALNELYNLLALAASDLKNDAVILRGRLSKLHSDKRKGILAHADEVLEFNRISDATLGLLSDMSLDSATLTPYLEDINDSIFRKTMDAKELDASITRKQMQLSDAQKNALFTRMAAVKDRNSPIRAIWLDDDLGAPELSEMRLIKALNVQIDRVYDENLVEGMITATPYDLIVSDMKRGENAKAGIDFLEKIVAHNIRVPMIFYVISFKEERGTPPYAFGITNSPSELVHLVMDIIERK
jgi:Effector-associated domain 11